MSPEQNEQTVHTEQSRETFRSTWQVMQKPIRSTWLTLCTCAMRVTSP